MYAGGNQKNNLSVQIPHEIHFMGPNKDINIQKNTVCAPVRVTPECSP
jgi:hypothetical protein